MKSIKPLIKTVCYDLFKLLYLTIITPDPCRRCIVRAMCSEVCDERAKFIDIFGAAPNIQRLNAYAIVFGFVAIIWGGLTLIFK